MNMNTLFPAINDNKLLFIDFSNNKTYKPKKDIVLEEIKTEIDQVFTNGCDEVEIPKEFYEVMSLQPEFQSRDLNKEN